MQAKISFLVDDFVTSFLQLLPQKQVCDTFSILPDFMLVKE